MSAMEETLKFMPQIQRIRLFSCLSSDELNTLLCISTLIEYNKGEKIVFQDEIGDALFAVVRGAVDVSIKDISDNDVVISSIKSGEVFGEAAIFMTARRTASITAATDTTVIRIKRKDLLSFFRSNPQAGNKILTLIILSLLKKLKNTNEDLVLEKQSDIDFDYVDNMVQEFISETGHDDCQ
ncbi:MAG: cyclic nucleotide-binding domain-containing protein [Deltaproteobacteria bacterium]|nr:cyclic nucleotide-binding domain-containing protein [Deltaproteobacteria bacterium]